MALTRPPKQNLAFRSLDPVTQAEFALWVETLPRTEALNVHGVRSGED